LRNELLLHLMAKKGIICIHSVDGGWCCIATYWQRISYLR
jgi:hypothetical protein